MNPQQTSTYHPYPNLDKGNQPSTNPFQASMSYPSPSSTNPFQSSTSYHSPSSTNPFQASTSYHSPSSTNPFQATSSQFTFSHANTSIHGLQSHVPSTKLKDTCQMKIPKHDFMASPPCQDQSSLSHDPIFKSIQEVLLDNHGIQSTPILDQDFIPNHIIQDKPIFD